MQVNPYDAPKPVRERATRPARASAPEGAVGPGRLFRFLTGAFWLGILVGPILLIAVLLGLLVIASVLF